MKSVNQILKENKKSETQNFKSFASLSELSFEVKTFKNRLEICCRIMQQKKQHREKVLFLNCFNYCKRNFKALQPFLNTGNKLAYNSAKLFSEHI